MNGKLIYRFGRFDLYLEEDVNQINTIASLFDNPNGKLSAKNCEEIKNDKKFSKDGLIDFYIDKTGYGMDMWSKEENNIMSIVAEYIESFLEWDVEIKTEIIPTIQDGFEKIPKLDADGCLILKRK